MAARRLSPMSHKGSISFMARPSNFSAAFFRSWPGPSRKSGVAKCSSSVMTRMYSRLLLKSREFARPHKSGDPAIQGNIFSVHVSINLYSRLRKVPPHLRLGKDGANLGIDFLDHVGGNAGRAEQPEP